MMTSDSRTQSILRSEISLIWRTSCAGDFFFHPSPNSSTESAKTFFGPNEIDSLRKRLFLTVDFFLPNFFFWIGWLGVCDPAVGHLQNVFLLVPATGVISVCENNDHFPRYFWKKKKRILAGVRTLMTSQVRAIPVYHTRKIKNICRGMVIYGAINLL